MAPFWNRVQRRLDTKFVKPATHCSNSQTDESPAPTVETTVASTPAPTTVIKHWLGDCKPRLETCSLQGVCNCAVKCNLHNDRTYALCSLPSGQQRETGSELASSSVSSIPAETMNKPKAVVAQAQYDSILSRIENGTCTEPHYATMRAADTKYHAQLRAYVNKPQLYTSPLKTALHHLTRHVRRGLPAYNKDLSLNKLQPPCTVCGKTCSIFATYWTQCALLLQQRLQAIMTCANANVGLLKLAIQKTLALLSNVPSTMWPTDLLMAMLKLMMSTREKILFTQARYACKVLLVQSAERMLPLVCASTRECRTNTITMHALHFVYSVLRARVSLCEDCLDKTGAVAARNWLVTAGFETLPKVRITDSTTRFHDVDLTPDKPEGGSAQEPGTILAWNVNGLLPRIGGLDGPPTSIENVIELAGFPTHLCLTETRTDWKRLRSKVAFLDFLTRHGYRYLFMHWTSSNVKQKAGYAGVMLISKIRPTSVTVGVNNKDLDLHARVLSAVYSAYTMLIVYSPNAGSPGDPRALPAKLRFNKALAARIVALRTDRPTTPLLAVGDFNCAPRRKDWHSRAFARITKAEYSADRWYPAIRTDEVDSHRKLMRAFDAVDAWDKLNGARADTYTWFPTPDRTVGMRLDHVLATPDLFEPTSDLQITQIDNLQEAGNSDHTPLLVNLQGVSVPAPANVAIKLPEKRTPPPAPSVPYGDVVFQCATPARRHTHRGNLCPRILVDIGEQVLVVVAIDAGSDYSVLNYLPKRGGSRSTLPMLRHAQAPFHLVGIQRHVRQRPQCQLEVQLDLFGHNLAPIAVPLWHLQRHEPDMCDIVLGMDVIWPVLKGAFFTLDAGTLFVTFGCVPGQRFACLNTQAMFSYSRPRTILDSVPLMNPACDLSDEVAAKLAKALANTYEASSATAPVRLTDLQPPAAKLTALLATPENPESNLAELTRWQDAWFSADRPVPVRSTEPTDTPAAPPAGPPPDSALNDPPSSVDPTGELPSSPEFADTLDPMSEPAPSKAALCLAAMEKRWSESPMPHVHVTVQLRGCTPWATFRCLIDSGSTYNLVSRSALRKLGKPGSMHAYTSDNWELPTLLLAGSQRQTAVCAERMRLRLPTARKGLQETPMQTVYCFDSLPVDLIIGSTTLMEWASVLDYSTKTWCPRPEGEAVRFRVPFLLEQGGFKRAAVALYATEAVTLDPQSVRVLPVQPSGADKRQIKGKFGFVEPAVPNGMSVFHQQTCASWNPSYVQLANKSTEPVTVGRGTLVSMFHVEPHENYTWLHTDEVPDLQDPDLDAQYNQQQTDGKSFQRRKLNDGTVLPVTWGTSSAMQLTPSQCTRPPELAAAAVETRKRPATTLATEDVSPDYSAAALAPLTDEQIDQLLQKQAGTSRLDFSSTALYVSAAEMRQLKEWCLKRHECFTDGSLSMQNAGPAIHGHSMKILTTAPNPPVRARRYSMNPVDGDTVREEVAAKLAQGVIEPARSPWMSNVLVVRRDGKVRLCQDYRVLNKYTVKDQYTLPKIADLFNVLSGTKWFSVCDASQSFHQIPLADERSKNLTAFITPDGLTYRYKYMCYGLVNAPACWSRLIDDCLAGLQWKTALTYMDDCAVVTKSADLGDHLADLDQVFDRLHRFGIKMKAQKCVFAVHELPFLGHLLTREGVKPNPNKIKAVTEITEPTSVKELRSRLGLLSYYRRFIKDFATICAPLTELLKTSGKKKFVFPADAQAAFAELKHKLTSEPLMLQHANFDAPFILDVDASDVGLGAVISNKIDGVERPIQYLSRKLTDMEKRYHAYEKEALALIWAVEALRPYLYGRHFTVRTDNRALRYLQTRTQGARVLRWVMRLQEYTFDVKHRPGKRNLNADGLSRCPLDDVDPYNTGPQEPLYETRASVSALMATRSQSRAQAETLRSPEAAEKSAAEERFKAADTIQVGAPTGGAHSPAQAMSKGKTQPTTGLKGSWFEPLPEPLAARVHKPRMHSFFEETEENGWRRADFVRLQQDPLDKEMAAIQALAALPSTTERKFTVLQDGLLVKEPADKHQRRRVVVPKKLRAFVLGMHHNGPLTCHVGRNRTQKLVARLFWWNGMTRDVRAWVRECDLCERRKTPRPMRVGPARTMIQTMPWHTVAVDIVGPCVETTNGNRWILTMIDVFTRFPICVPIPDRRASTIMRAIYEHLICQHGVPDRILSDRGKEFIAKAVKSLCAVWGLAKIETSGYHSAGNSVERWHRWLNSAMTIMYDRNTVDWDLILPAILYSYRVTINDATGFSPAQLVYGRELNLPLDILFNHDGLTSTSFSSEADWANHLHKSLTKAFELARKCQQQAAATRTKRLNASRMPSPHFPKDCTVWYWTRKTEANVIHHEGRILPLRSKWANWWDGPYKFLGWDGDQHVLIQKDGESALRTHINRVTRRHAGEVSTSTWTGGLTNTCPDPVVEDRSETGPVRMGEHIVFPTNACKLHPSPFGVGRITKIGDGKTNFEFQWCGNTRTVLDGAYNLCWYVPTTDKWYYRATREPRGRTSHTPYTSFMTGTTLNVTDIIVRGFDLFDENKRFHGPIWDTIVQDRSVAQFMGNK